MPQSSSSPRFREIIEGALGNVIAAIILAVLGIAGGITIGWFPTFIILLIVVGVFTIWYKFDPSLQRLISQRLFKIRHAISGESVVLSRWNLIAHETISDIANQNNLMREFLNVEHRRNVNFKGKEYLELVIRYQISGTRWLAVVDNNGNVVDLYGNVEALVSECNNCGSTILVRYWKLRNGDIKTEPQTTCRRCKKVMIFSYFDPEQITETEPTVKDIKKPTVQVKDGAVAVTIQFTIQNYGRQKDVCPKIQLLVALLEGGKFVEKLMSANLKKIALSSNIAQRVSYRWDFPLSTIILADRPGGLKIMIPEC